MTRLEIYKKQAKQLVRWHREGNHSIGGRIRGLARYKTLTDRQALALTFPLREAQEIIAVEAGHESWAALKAAVANEPTPARRVSSTPRLTRAVPIIFVANVQASAEFFRDTLGFSIDFLHGHPPFYGAVSRDSACVHLKFVHEPVFAIGTHDRDGLIMAFIEVENVKALYAEYLAAGVKLDQKLKKQAWGGRDFIVRDLDGNGICFVGLNV
jgi:catechol 2,3-dioxygenase-like lactoylglutathione lyase family enzyme